MDQFKFLISAILDKVRTKTQLDSDIKSLGDIFVKLIGRFDIPKTKAQAERDLSGVEINVDLNPKVNKQKVNREVQNVVDQAQKQVNNKPVEITLALKKDKLINDIKSWGQRNSKLFSDENMSSKYYQLLNSAQFASSSRDISNLRLQLSALNSEIRATNLSGRSLSETLKMTFRRSTELASSFGATMALSRLMRNAWKEAIELDTTYTNLIKVQDELSRSDYADYLEKCNKKAKDLATTQKSLIEATTEFSKSGYGLNQAEKLTEKSTILSNVGEMSASDSAKAIISGVQAYETINGFTEVEKKAEALIDLYNELGNTTAATTSEIAKGVQMVGSVFADANTDVYQFSSLLAAGQRQFQDADSLALGLRTSALRIRGCTSELKAMGAETDGVIESTSKLEDKIKALTNVNGSGGVRLLEDDEKTFRSMYDIFVDIGSVYRQMSDVDQSSLLSIIAGTQRSSAISAVLNNMAEAQEIYQNSLNSTGSAQREYEKYLSSTEASLNRFGATMTETYQSVINGETVKGIVNCGSATLEFANDLGLVESTIKGFVAIGLVKVLTTLSTAFKASAINASNFGTALNTVKNFSTMTRDTQAYANALNTLRPIIGNLSDAQLKQVLSDKALSNTKRSAILQTTGLTEAQSRAKLAQMGFINTTNAQTTANTGATASTFSLSAAVKGLGLNMKAAFMSNPIGISLMAISVALGAVTSKMADYKQKLEDARQANIETANTAAESAKNLSDLYVKYNKLNDIQDKTSSQEDDFKSVVEDVTKALGDKAEMLKGLTAGTEEYTTALESATKAELESYYADAKIGAKAAEESLREKTVGKLGTSKITIEPIGEIKNVKGADSHNAALNEIRSIMAEFESFGYNGLEWQPINPSDMKSVTEFYYTLIEARDKLAKSDNSDLLMSSDIYGDINTTIVGLSDAVDTYIKKQYEVYKINHEINNTLPKTTKEFKDMEAEILGSTDAGDRFNAKISELLHLDFSSLIQELSKVNNEINSVAAKPISKSGMISDINELSSGFESLDKIMSSIKGKNPFDYSLLDDKTFKDTFGEMGESYVNFIEQISNTPNDINACQSAFNELVTTWIDSTDILKNITDETANLTVSMLTNMGVTNADVIVTETLAQKQRDLAAEKYYNSVVTSDLTGETIAEANQIYSEAEAAGVATQELARLALEKLNVNENKIDTASDIDQVINLANAAGSSAAALKALTNAKAVLDSSISDSFSDDYDPQRTRYAYDTMNKVYSNTFDYGWKEIDANKYKSAVYGGGTKTNKSGSDKKPKEETTQDIDWIEKKIKYLKDEKSRLESEASSSIFAYLGLTPEELARAKEILGNTEDLMSKDTRELRDIAKQAGISIQDLNSIIETGTVNSSKQSYLAQIVEQDKLLLDEYGKAIEKYRNHYEESVSGISPEMRSKIENNFEDINIDTLPDKEAKAVLAANSAYEKLQETISAKRDLEKDYIKDIKAESDNVVDYYDQQMKRIESTNNLIKGQMDYAKSSGQVVSAFSYEELIANNEKTISYLEKKIAERKKELQKLLDSGQITTDSEDYYNIVSEIESAEESRLSTLTDIQEIYNDLLNLPIDNMDVVISMYENITDTIQRWGSEMEASGKKLDKEYYQSLIKNGMKVIDQYKEQYDLVRDVMDEYDTGSEKWNTLYSKLQSINSAMSSMVENLYKWNEALLQLPFDSVSTLSDNLSKALSAMTNVQSEYDTVISAVVGAIKEEIDLLNEARDAANEENQAQIDELQSRLDLLNQQNEALKLQAAYEQALYDLQNANTQKTERVIRDGQIIYENSSDAIRKASEDVQDALLDLEKYNLEQQISALNDELDAVNDQYEEQIKNLEKISEKWSEITSKIEQAKSEVTATDILGNGWKDKVLSGNDDDIFNMFSGMYQSISDQITLYEDQIASTENIEALLQDYITAYKEGTITYEQAMTGINGLLSQLNEKMSAMDNLNNVIDYVGAVTGTDDLSVSGILSAIQESLKNTGEELIKSFELYNENAGNISEYTTSWEQLTTNVSDIKDILEEVRDNLEDALDEIARSRDDEDGELENDLGDRSSGTITSGINHSDYGPSFGTESPQYADGMEKGLVGKPSSDSGRENLLRTMVLNRIEDPANAVPAILHRGEGVLNRNQQDILFENYGNAYNAIPDWFSNYREPNFDFSGIGNGTGEVINYNIGDINIERCDNPDQLAKAIKNGLLSSALRQELGRR